MWWWTPTCHRSGGLSAPRARGWPPTRSLMQNMSTKTKPDGGALPLILERWLSRIKMDVADAGGAAEGDPDFDRLVEKRVRQVVGSLEGWSTALNSLRPCCCTIRRTTPETMRGNPGRSLVPGRIRHQDGGQKRVGYPSDRYRRQLVRFPEDFRLLPGPRRVPGMLVIVDELVNLYKIPQAVTRQSNYEKILTVYNDVLQGKARHIGFAGRHPSVHGRQIPGRIQLRSAPFPPVGGTVRLHGHPGSAVAHHPSVHAHLRRDVRSH